MLKQNDQAPGFSLASDDGTEVSLDQFRGKKVVLYFYPKDNTPGCTREACSFRDDYSIFAMKGAVVIGVSPDASSSHQRFRAKLNLPFYLLTDADHAVATAYGAWGEKKRSGRVYEGILRSTFVIDEDGRLLRIFRKVKPSGHAQEVLQVL